MGISFCDVVNHSKDLRLATVGTETTEGGNPSTLCELCVLCGKTAAVNSRG